MPIDRKQATARHAGSEEMRWTDRGVSVGALMQRDVAYLRENVWADRAAWFMRSRDLEWAAVVDEEGKPRGIVRLGDATDATAGAPTEADAEAGDIRPLLVSTVARTVPVLFEGTPVESAREVLRRTRAEHLLLVDRDQTLVGAVTASALRERRSPQRWS